MIVQVPGDKSLTQRALIFAALAEGDSRLRGLLFGGDAGSTASALRSLGATIPELPSDGSEIVVRGVGPRGTRAPLTPLDLGNSGTGSRLLMGVLAGSDFTSSMTGDASLRSRPMGRVTKPLTAMGADFAYLEREDRLPVRIRGTHPLRDLDYDSPVASAQVKSALLLAGITGQAFVLVTEPRRSRDHTERFLEQLGVGLVEHAVEGGWRVELREPPDRLPAFDFRVPGDVSSAAFLFGLGALGATKGPLTVRGVGINPTRTAFLDVLIRMGASVEVRTEDGGPGEPVGDVTVGPGELMATDIQGAEVPGMIDELPMAAILAVRAHGVTTIRGAAELRAKESDRIDALVRNLRAVGVEVEEFEDGLAVVGTDAPLAGRIESFDDHRIAMAFGVLGKSHSCDIKIDDPGVADVSFPGFWRLLDQCTGT